MIHEMPQLEQIDVIEPEIPFGETILQTLDKHVKVEPRGGVVVSVDAPHHVQGLMGASDQAVYIGRTNDPVSEYGLGKPGMFLFRGPGRDVITASMPPYLLQLNRDKTRIVFDIGETTDVLQMQNIGAKIEQLQYPNLRHRQYEAYLRIGGLLE